MDIMKDIMKGVAELQEKAHISEATARIIILENALQEQLHECYTYDDYRPCTEWDRLAETERKMHEREIFNQMVEAVRQMGIEVTVNKWTVTLK